MYDVEFPDRAVKKYSANIITENVLSRVYPDGFYTNVISHVLDHKRDGSAVPMSDKYIKTKSGQMWQRQTTTGWSFQVKWRDGLTSWVALKDLKETNPVDIAEYAVAR